MRLWLPAVLGLTADLWSKAWAFTQLDPAPGVSRQIIPGFLSFRRTLNEGALFGLGQGLWLVFIAASIAALGFVWYLFSHSTRDRRSLHVGLAMILAGAMGNLFDRAFVHVDVVRTTRGSDTGLIIADTPDYIELGTYPDKALPRRIPKADSPVITSQGVVRDFIKLDFAGLNIWPWIFNVADVWLVMGVGLLLLNFWWERREAKAHEAHTTRDDSSTAESS
ncbi:MAG: signal peptidase II [Phycisphaerae bacterium]|nr:signal peptidase II [Phycisphaerae bacterium]